jgi:hypothetical protein
MANFASVANLLEGIINSQLTFARHNQGVWEWYNALQRIMSANRFTGTPRVYGPTTVTAETEIEAGAVRLFGVLLDNAMSGEDAFLAIANLTAANWTAGTSDPKGYLYVPRSTCLGYLYSDGLALDTAFTIEDILGTEAGIEAGTGSTSGVTVVAVYTE